MPKLRRRRLSVSFPFFLPDYHKFNVANLGYPRDDQSNHRDTAGRRTIRQKSGTKMFDVIHGMRLAGVAANRYPLPSVELRINLFF